MARIIVVFFVISILFIPVIIFMLTSMSHTWMTMIVLIFFILFAGMISLLTEADVPEIFIGTATYGAVLVTFLGNLKSAPWSVVWGGSFSFVSLVRVLFWDQRNIYCLRSKQTARGNDLFGMRFCCELSSELCFSVSIMMKISWIGFSAVVPKNWRKPTLSTLRKPSC